MNDPVLGLTSVLKGYGARPVLSGLTLQVRPGEIYALLGRNGTGKTTAIQVALGLIRPDSGSVTVFGQDPWLRAAEVHQRIGLVSEDRPLYDWMTVEETLRFHAAFYPSWDAAYATTLLERLALKRTARVGSLSRGLRGSLCLLCALAYRPELLILDEPTAGLDATVRRRFIEQTIDIVAERGRTVLFSSHLIDEVERVADRVGILHHGRLILETGLEELRGACRLVSATFDGEPALADTPVRTLARRRSGQSWALYVQDFSDKVIQHLERIGGRHITVGSVSLEDLFIECTRTDELEAEVVEA